MKKILNEGNQIHNVISSSGSVTVINYGSDSGSGSTSQKVTVPTVPVPQRGVQVEFQVVRKGFFPKGGGEVNFFLQPLKSLKPIHLVDPGQVHRERSSCSSCPVD